MSEESRKEVWETVVDFGRVDEDAATFLAKLTRFFESIPEKCRSSAVVEVDSEESAWGGYNHWFTLKYLRPETDDELAARLRLEARRAEHERKRDLQQLEYLKRTYEPVVTE
jgi:hypothetical protein